MADIIDFNDLKIKEKVSNNPDTRNWTIDEMIDYLKVFLKERPGINRAFLILGEDIPEADAIRIETLSVGCSFMEARGLLDIGSNLHMVRNG